MHAVVYNNAVDLKINVMALTVGLKLGYYIGSYDGLIYIQIGLRCQYKQTGRQQIQDHAFADEAPARQKLARVDDKEEIKI